VLLVPAERADTLMARLESPATAPATGNTAEGYVVRSGDSLSAIASRQGVSVEEIRRHNDLNGDVIHAGQVLELPQRSLASR